MLDFTIDKNSCTSCQLCVRDCVAQVIVMENGYPHIPGDMESTCYRCQHCLAVCPTGALSILGLKAGESLKLDGSFPDPAKMEMLIKGRRSVRSYKPENLDAETIDRLLSVAWHAPTGRNSRQVRFTVLDDREKLARLRTGLFEGLDRLVQADKLPEGLEFFAQIVKQWQENRVDGLFRGAPHLLIASAPATCASPIPDCIIALSYFELFAQSMGIGTVWDGLAKLAINDLLPEFKARLQIPEDHVIGYMMAFGKPAIRFARTTQHRPALISRPSFQ